MADRSVGAARDGVPSTGRFRRWFPAGAPALIGCVLALLAAQPVRAAASRAQLPPQGLYENCMPATQAGNCIQRLKAMGRAGFRLVLNYSQWSATPRELLAYARTAQSLGMKVIWPLDDAMWRDGSGGLARMYPALGAGCACSDDGAFLRHVIGLVRKLPATWGYYIGDEVPADQLPAVRALAAKIKALDPSHPQLYIANGTCLDPSANLAPFGGVAEVVGSDAYPVGWPGISAGQFVGSVATTDRQIATAHHGRAAVALQAFSWSQDPNASTAPNPRWPTEREMQAMRDAAITRADPELILWFSYMDIAASDNRTAHWRELLAAAFAGAPPTSRHLPAAAPSLG